MEISFIKFLFIFCIPPVISISAQVETKKWTAAEVQYQVSTGNTSAKKVSSFSYIDAARFVYNKLISDVDGDNCPFQPTCSSFFVESVKITNLFQGVLMGADRLTRDLNLVKNHYPVTFEGRFIDPSGNYTLNKNLIHLPVYLDK